MFTISQYFERHFKAQIVPQNKNVIPRPKIRRLFFKEKSV